MTGERGPYFKVDSDTMRQPTNLELAQFMSIQSAVTLASLRAIMIGRDILADDEDKGHAAEDYFDTMSMCQAWWVNLIHDDAPGLTEEELRGDGE